MTGGTVIVTGGAGYVGSHACKALDAPRRPGDPPILVADPTRAGATLGWQPRISDLEAIVSSAVRWHASAREQPSGTKPQLASS